MDDEYLARLCDARDTLCNYCEVDDCESCMISKLINCAFDELTEEDYNYVN